MPADTDKPIRAWQLAVMLLVLVVISPLLALHWLWKRLRGRAPAEVRRRRRASRPARPVWWRRWGRSLTRRLMGLLQGILELVWFVLYEVDDSNRFSSTYRFRWLGLVVVVIVFVALAGAVTLLAYGISRLIY